MNTKKNMLMLALALVSGSVFALDKGDAMEKGVELPSREEITKLNAGLIDKRDFLITLRQALALDPKNVDVATLRALGSSDGVGMPEKELDAVIEALLRGGSESLRKLRGSVEFLSDEARRIESNKVPAAERLYFDTDLYLRQIKWAVDAIFENIAKKEVAARREESSKDVFLDAEETFSK